MKKSFKNFALGFVYFSNVFFFEFALGLVIGMVLGITFTIMIINKIDPSTIISYIQNHIYISYISFILFLLLCIWLSAKNLNKNYLLKDKRSVINWASLFNSIIILSYLITNIIVYKSTGITMYISSISGIVIFYLFSQFFLKEDPGQQEIQITYDNFFKTNKFRLFLFLVLISIMIYGTFSTMNKYLKNQTLKDVKAQNQGLSLETDPYINNTYGFQINLPKGWKINPIEKDSGFVFRISDPSLTYSSGIAITLISIDNGEIPMMASSTFQDNYVKLLTNVSSKQGQKIQNVERVSSSTIKIEFTDSKSMPGFSLKSSSSIIFTNNGIYFVAVVTSKLDKQDYVENLLLESVKTFKVLETSPGLISYTDTQLSWATDKTKEYINDNFKYSFKYPLNWDWVFTSASTDYADSPVFVYQSENLKGPTKTATMTFLVTTLGRPTDKLEDDINLITSNSKINSLSSISTSVTRNIQLLPTNMPSDVQAETVQVQSFDKFEDGTKTETMNLYFFAIRGQYHYRFMLKSDIEDYESLYPLASNIIKSIRFR